MKKYKALYKGMYDDLKDSEMMIDYAFCIREEGDKTLADEIAKYAQYRPQHFSDFHKLFEQEVSKEKEISMETVHKCMWKRLMKLYKNGMIKQKEKSNLIEIGRGASAPLFYSH